jgi:hypothetical protein
MTIAFDSAHDTAIISSGGSFSVVPVGTPRAVIGYCVRLTSDGDLITGATYGGVPMVELANSPLAQSSGEQSSISAFFLGSGIPTGSQLFAITGTGSSSILVYVVVYTAADDCEIVAEATLNSAGIIDPSDTIALAGRLCAVVEGLASGKNFSFQLAALATWTFDDGDQAGSMSSGEMHSDIVDSVDVTFGWLQAAPAEEASAIAAAISEVQLAGGGTLPLLGVE